MSEPRRDELAQNPLLPHFTGIRAVFFDAVGTVIFPNPTITEIYGDVAVRHGGQRKPLDELRQSFARSFAEQETVDITLNWRTSDARERERWQIIVASSLDDVTNPDAAFEELYQHFSRGAAWRVPTGIAGVLDSMQSRGLILGMGSNYDSRLIQVMDELTELRLLRDRLVISSLVGCRKPAKAFFEAVIARAGVPAESILFVGDDLQNDLQGAQAAGLQAVLLDPNQRGPLDQPRIQDLTDLLTVIRD